MAVHKILVEVTDGKPVHPTEVNDETTPTEVAPKKKTKRGKKPSLDAIVGAAVFNMGRTIALGAVARVGEATGDYYTQRKLTNFMSIANYGLAIAAGGVAGVAYTVLDMGFKIHDYNLQKTKSDLETDLYRQKVGLSSISGSRYKGRKI
jgi:hypothetical protein